MKITNEMINRTDRLSDEESDLLINYYAGTVEALQPCLEIHRLVYRDAAHQLDRYNGYKSARQERGLL